MALVQLFSPPAILKMGVSQIGYDKGAGWCRMIPILALACASLQASRFEASLEFIACRSSLKLLLTCVSRV